MTYSRRNIAEEQVEASQKANQIMDICEKLHITLDPIDWKNSGMRSPVTVQSIQISDLMDLGKRDSDFILRRVQMKLLEHAALETVKARPGLNALMWSPVSVVQPQEFLSLWAITLETDERIAIAEYIRNGQRVYEHYALDVNDLEQLANLFGPMNEGDYSLGETITVEEHERKFTGEIVYILPPGKATSHHKSPSRVYHTHMGKAYTNEVSSRYLVDCHDGFPHIVNQSQIVQPAAEEN
jgi:hypothetical protein